ncbi:hypothetical protein ACLOJK_033078 [Asimina triloba]
MALRVVSLCPPRSPPRLQQNLEGPPKSTLSNNAHMGKRIRCAVATGAAEPPLIRRDANYQPAAFDFDFLQSLKSTYTGDAYLRRIDRMVEEARGLLMETTQPIAKLELIGSLQHLGLDYHYENEIRQALEELRKLGQSELGIEKHLSATSLFFRLLRQYGYEVSTDVFNSFLDETGSFKSCLCQDIRGLLSLYEASHLGFIGEDICDEAKAFTTKHLKQVLAQGQVLDPPHLSEQIKHALELPVRYMDSRFEARWYIEEVYEKEEHMRPSLLELAKLDYNRLQALYQRNLIDMSRWWKDLGTVDKMPFIRDRIVESFLFGLGVSIEPQHQYCRDEVTKAAQLVTMVDDIYDVFGSMEELELFTDAMRRWDTDAIQNLPDYMKVCYMVLFNTVNALAYDTLKEQGVDVIPCLRKLV